MTALAKQPPPVDSSNFQEIAQTLVTAIMKSADPRKIPPTEWWRRAGTALQSAAQWTMTRPLDKVRFSTLVSRMCEALQIEAMTLRAAAVVLDLSSRPELASGSASLLAFAHYCRDERVFIVAMVQAEKAETKARWIAEQQEAEAKAEEDRLRWQEFLESASKLPVIYGPDGSIPSKTSTPTTTITISEEVAQ